MAKTGRNSPCPCGSGKKFKKCCGNPQTPEMTDKALLSPEVILPATKRMVEHYEARELTRKQQQGLGRPIIAKKYKGKQVIAVGNSIHMSPHWKTVPDFLSDYIKKIIGEKWGNSELVKKFEDRHTLLQWYDKFCKLGKKHILTPGEITSLPATGVFYCYLGLAYNLYLLEHNIELQQRFIERLRDINNFQGVYYELIVANCLIRSGFELSLEDECDAKSKHCEFSAISTKTQKKFWIEAKMRGVAGILGKTTENGTTNSDPTNMISKHLRDAFQKPASDKRLIFIDVNTKPEEVERPKWIERAYKKLDMKEKDLLPGQSAYVFITNMGFHWDLDTVLRNHVIMVYGLGIPDFEKKGAHRLSDIYKRKQRHIDIYHIAQAFKDYPQIPSTFDGSLPSETFSNNSLSLKIGDRYFFENIGEKGTIATITSATVDEKNKIIYIGTDKGQILKQSMSENELNDYRNHPDTYFGVVYEQPKRTDDLYEFFEQLVKIHMSYPKNNILKQLENCKDFDKLKDLDHVDLVLEHCERLAASLGWQPNSLDK